MKDVLMESQGAQDDHQEKMLVMNEALLLGSLRQHQLIEETERLNAELRAEVAERKRTEIDLGAVRDQLGVELEGMQRLHQLATRFLRHEDLHALLKAVLDAAITTTRADKGFLQLPNPVSGELAITVQRGFEPAYFEFSHHIDGKIACGTATETRRCVIIEDVTLSPLFLAEPRDLELKLGAGIRAMVCTPLLTRASRLAGFLSVHFGAPHRPTERDLRLLDLVAQQAADFIESTHAEEAQGRLAAIVRWSDDAILSNKLDGTIRTWNAGAERMFGYRAQEVIGRPVTILIPPERAEEENQMLERLKHGESIDHFETVRVTKDNRRLDVSLTISPLNDSQGRVGGVSQIVRDIGDLVQARGVLARSREDLEGLVDERTAKLREAMDELEHMSYSMVHDMRAPLRAMRTFAMMLEEEGAGCLQPVGLDYLRRIRDSAHRMDRLVTDALSYNQIVRQELPVTTVEVGGLIRGMIDSYPDLQPAAADIEIEFKELAVMGNESLLTQCISNLLGNAVKFVAPGVRPRIRIRAESRQESIVASTEQAQQNLQDAPRASTRGLIRIWFEDNGIGIREDAQERIFRMFQRMHHEKEYPGTGIGLAIVRKAVERMGGRVGLESEPGKGSQFWIELRKANS